MIVVAVRAVYMRLEGAPDAAYSRVLTGTGRIYLGKKPAAP